jgi:hypothetical protein
MVDEHAGVDVALEARVVRLGVAAGGLHGVEGKALEHGAAGFAIAAHSYFLWAAICWSVVALEDAFGRRRIRVALAHRFVESGKLIQREREPVESVRLALEVIALEFACFQLVGRFLAKLGERMQRQRHRVDRNKVVKGRQARRDEREA